MDFKQQVHEKVKAYQEDMIRDIFEIVSVDSVKTEAKEGKPFGDGPAAALAKAEMVAKRLGFKTTNLDNYVVYTHSGEGKERIGVLGHVDIVPLGEGWSKNPLGGDRDAKFIYGRGVSDNKGPSVMSLYALKIIQELGIPLTKEVRIVLGANEESGMLCVKHYREIEGGFDYAFAPDAAFPVTFGEKGSYRANFSGSKVGKGNVKLISAKGGNAPNVVCPACDVVLHAGQETGSIKEQFMAYLAAHQLHGNAQEEASELHLRLEGVAAHASRPELGINSISHMMAFLGTVLEDVPFVNGYNTCVGMAYNGENCGVDVSDQYGRLTFNIGMISTEDNTITSTIDIRYPVTIQDFAPHAESILNCFSACGLEIKGARTGKPLFVAPDSPLVKILSEVYVDITGDTVNKPATMGGGTYAKNFDNCVAFGAEFVGDENSIHNVDERIEIAKMLKATEIIVHALVRLLKHQA